MEIVLLGTGAADGWPNPFCECASCAAVRRAAPVAVRAHASALVDATLLLDAGPDVPLAASRHGVSLAGVQAVLLTHAHPDHVAPQFALWRHWARVDAPLRIVGPEPALRLFDDWLAPDDDVVREPVVAGVDLDVAGFRVRALAAGHGDEITGPGVLYDITAPDGGRLLYATDTGPLPQDSLVATTGAAYDVVLLEETWGDEGDHPDDHLDLRTFAATLAELRRRGAVVPATRVVPTHLGHRNPPPGELARRMAAWGVELLPDGARITGGDVVAPDSSPRRTLLIGGARSGKSTAAERLLAAEPDVTYVATGAVDDDEWRARVAAHRARRPAHWDTVEGADLPKLLAAHTPEDAPLLVDCLTLWLAGEMDAAGCWSDADSAGADTVLAARVAELVHSWRDCRGRVVAVTNEVGQGVVPATASGRRFRDEMGRLNAAIAAASDEVLLVTAGLLQPLR